MAWPVWKVTRSGARHGHVQWRDPLTGKVRSHALGPVDDLTMAVEVQRARIAIEGKPAAVRWLSSTDLLAAFLGHLTAKHNRPASITMTRQVLVPLFEAWKGTPVARWSRPMLEVYLAQHPGWAARTIQMLVNTCRHLARWAEEAGIGCPDFVGRLRAPKVVKKEPRGWTTDEVARLLAESKRVRGKRYVVAVHLAALAALSQGDLRTITWGEVDLVEGWITRREGRRKTGAPMRVRIVPQLAAVLPAKAGHAAALVLPWFPAKDAALHALHRLCDKAGVPRGGWHRFRTSLASAMDAQHAGIAAIGRALAHRAGSAQTLRYIRSQDDLVAASMEAAATALAGGA